MALDAQLLQQLTKGSAKDAWATIVANAVEIASSPLAVNNAPSEVIKRDRVCVLCGQPGRDVDHIIRGQDHSLSNLRLLCRSCHMQRTGRDGGTAKRAPKRKWDRSEAHPGRRTGG